ncbi:ABC transporter substrate-binding protein [Clostridium fermenticellae]|uniref:ABC transporter substrate-binding protein n=1 Tax=Clostridium fermenticellae TaxID=2068654 RepID=A0A386H2M2_9CLOT|nr:ABC transporter substrate-binding protein [Clostridium fermenticellae]AYD39952.1 ABC transporter substrate-binding protein [Clostridium fermenticellae]
MFKKKWNLILVFLIMFSLIFTGCSSSNSNNQSSNNTKKNEVVKNTTYPLEVSDSLKKQIVIKNEPKRVISLSPNITEIIYALNKQGTLVGRTDYCDYPKAALKIQSLGSITDPNVEKIVELKPDLIITSSLTKPDTLKKLQQLKLNVLVLSNTESFENTYDLIKTIGNVLNENQKAYTVVSNMKQKIQNVESKIKGKSKPSVYYIISYGKNGDFTAGKDTFIGKMINMAGGKNAADDVMGWNYSLEKLIEKNPDIMICSNKFNSKAGIKSANGYKDLKAVKDNKLFEINDDLIDRQGPRLADGFEALAKIIHPEAFK